MNKIYRVIWNASLGAWVAVSELATSKVKTKSVKTVVVGFTLTSLSSMAIAAAGTNGGTASGQGATAISANTAQCSGAQSGLQQARASGALSIAIGCSSIAESGRGIAIGSESFAGGDNESIAIGRQAKARGDQSIAIGGQSEAKGGSSIAIGADDLDRVASKNPPAYNQSGNNDTYNNSQVAKEFKSLTGSYLVNFEQNDGAATPGPGRRYTKTTAGEAAVSLGTKSYSADLATAVGTASTASGIASVALGVRSTAEGKGALAIGPISSASKEGSTAIGINSTASGINSIAMGRGATASQDGSVALGSGSLANNATLNTVAYSPTGSISDITGKTDLTTLKQISVGTITEERRITNVAPGGNDTDAVNVSQLKRLKVITDKTGSDIAKNLGGGSTFNPATGAVTNPTYTIGGNNYTNVGTALKASKTEVVQGKNITVTDKLGDDGQTIYTVNAKDTTATAGSDAVTVAGTTDNATNITDYKVDLSQGTKDSLVKADTALQTVVTQIDGENVKTINKDNNTANFVTGTNIKLESENGGIKVSTADDVTFTNVTSETMTVNNDNSVANGGDTNYVTEGNKSVVNGGDVYTAINTTEQQYTGDNGEIVKRNPTQVLTIKGGATTATENNIQTVANEDGSIAVKLAQKINLGPEGNVQLGNTLVDNSGVTIAGGPNGPVSITNTGLNNGGNTITNVAPGKENTDAVNVAQLYAVASKIPTVKAGDNVTVDTGTDENGQTVYTVNAAAAPVAEAAENYFHVNDGTGTQEAGDAATNKGAVDTIAGATGRHATAAGLNAKATEEAATAVGVNSKAEAQSALAVGNGASATGLASTAIGQGAVASGASTDDGQPKDGAATAVGRLSKATGGSSTALGSGATASNTHTVAVGASAVASGKGATALGLQATAAGAQSLAAGTNAAADGNSALAIGTDSKATGAYATAVGANVTAGGLNSITIGRSNNVTGGYTTVIGSGNIPKDGKGLDAAGGIVDVKAADTITATHSSIIGMSNQIAVSSVIGTPPPYAAVLTDVQVQGNDNIINRGHAYVFGSNNTINTDASNMELESVVAVGRQNTVSGNNSLAVGRLNTVAGDSALAVGINSQALGRDGIAIGNKAYANRGENPVALGGLTHAGQFGTALGARTSVEGDQGLAAATGAVVKGARAVAVGSYSFAGPEDAVALGHNTAATGSRAVAMGAGSVVSGARSGAWGIATNGGQPQNNTTDRSFVGGADSYAIGNKNIIGNTSSDSFVLGNNVKLGATGASIAITNVAGKDGTTNASTRTNAVTYTGATAITGAVALGSDTSVTVDNGVALGKGSVASTAAGQAGTDPLSAKDATASAGVWTATHAAVSVGNGTTVTRQITSVAAGTQDTDAVNVAQLKAAGFTLATSASAGEVQDDTTDVTTKKVKNGETVTVDAGKNIKVTQDGKKVSIATKDEVEFTQITLGDSTNNTVLTSTTDGLDVGGDKITNVANGDVSANSKEAINGSQLYTTNQNVANNATAIANNATEIAKGLNFGANDQTATAGDAIKRQLGETIGIKGGITDTSTATSGENVITRTDANGNINIELAKNAKFDSVTTGGTKLSDAGLSFVDTSGSPVANSPSISNTGINAGNQVIAGVKAGTQDTDAVNVAQLNAKTATTPLTVGNTGAVDALAPADTNKLVTAGDIANAINKAGFTLTTVTTANGELGANSTNNELINAGDTVTVEADKNIKVTQTNGKISIATKDDVNFNSVTAGSGANQVVLGDDGVKVGGNTYISDAGLNANDKKITNVANGDISANSKDAINGSQLRNTADDIASIIGGNATVDNAGNVTASNIGGTGANTIDDAIKTVKTTVKSTDNTIKVTANTANANDGTVFDISVDAQKLAESAQLPVVYTKADGTKVYKVGNSFFDNKEGTGTAIDATDVIASMQNADGTTATATKLANIAKGDVSSTSKDAINGSQLFAQGEGVQNIIGGNTTYNPNTGAYENNDIGGTGKGNINDAIQTVNTKADANATEIAKGLNFGANDQTATAGDAIKRQLGETIGIKGGITDTSTATSGENVITRTDANGNINIELAKNAKFDSVTTGNTLVDNSGITIKAPTGGTTTDVKLTAGGLNNGGNRITNVAPGVDATDAVNVSQLKAVEATANKGWNLTTNGKADSKSNVKPGDTVDFANTDGNVKIENTGNKVTVNLNKDIDLTKDGSVTIGDTKVNNDGLTIVGGPSVTKSGIDAGDKKITNVADGVISATSKDAVNGSQLYQAVNNINTSIAASKEEVKSADGSVTVTTTQNAKGANVYDLSVNTDGTTIKKNADGSLAVNTTPLTTNTDGKVNTPAAPNALATAGDIANAINNSGWKATSGETGSGVVDGTTEELINPSETVTFQAGDNMVLNQAGNVFTYSLNNDITIGKDGKDGDAGIDGKVGVNGKDGASVVLNGKDGSIGLNGKDGENGLTFKAADGAQGVNGKDGANGLPGDKGQTRIVYETKDKDGNSIQEQVANLNDGLIFTGNNEDTLNRHKLNTVVKVQGEGVDKAASQNFKSAAGNINVKANGSDLLEVQLSKNLDLTDGGSVKMGDTTVNSKGLTIKNGPSVTQDGINAGGKKVTNVADGKEDTDAVNVRQLKGAANALNNKINRNNREARAGIAGSNAAAALPQVYIPGKSMVAASAGTFKGESAVAVGYSRSSDNGKVILKLQGNANTRGDFGAGVGVGYQW